MLLQKRRRWSKGGDVRTVGGLLSWGQAVGCPSWATFPHTGASRSHGWTRTTVQMGIVWLNVWAASGPKRAPIHYYLQNPPLLFTACVLSLLNTSTRGK